MRLYLSSYRLGDCPNKIVDFCRNRRVAIIGNALDHIPAVARRDYETNVYDPAAELSRLGLTTESLDLRGYFGRTKELADVLKTFGLVWVLGGNAFLLMRAMRQSGFADVMPGLLQADQLAYGGFSAGAVVATPHLQGLELMDDPMQLADQYRSPVVWRGMGLVDFSIVPHFDSDHPESHLADLAIGLMKQRGLPHIPMRDGEVYIVDGDLARLYHRDPDRRGSRLQRQTS